MFKEFKTFIMRGNVLDLAIGVIIGAAFGNIVASLVGVWLFPANGSQIAAVNIDKTGTTRLSKIPVWHSFTIPMLVSWVSVVAIGLGIED